MDKNKLIVCIGRQLGSGGLVVARRLAERFGCQLYDRRLLDLAAKESGFNEKVFEHGDENKSLLGSLFHQCVMHLSETFYSNNLSPEALYKFQSEAIRHAAEAGRCVFVGRTADYVLRDNPNMVSVFIAANDDDRIERVRQRLGCGHDTAVSTIDKADERRASYYGFYTNKVWGAAASYDVCLNSSLLGIDGTVEAVAGIIDNLISDKSDKSDNLDNSDAARPASDKSDKSDQRK